MVGVVFLNANEDIANMCLVNQEENKRSCVFFLVSQ